MTDITDDDSPTGIDTERSVPNDASAAGPLRSPPKERSVPELLRFGVVNVDKPAGPSSHQLSAWVRDAINETLAEIDPDGNPIDGVAHAGTLDPKVTGCLPTLTGDATRAAQVFLEGDKEYVSVLELHDQPPADFDDIVAEFEDEIYQKPPRKSAVTRRLRTRTIHELDLLELDDRRALLRIECASGTYIRKLCHDIGLAAGTGAHMGHLRRTETVPFDDGTLHTLHDLIDALAWAEDGDDEPLRAVVKPAETAFAHLPSVTIAPSAARNVATGAPVYAPGVIDSSEDVTPNEGPDTADSNGDPPLVACYTPDGAAVCLGQLVGDPNAESGVVVSLARVVV